MASYVHGEQTLTLLTSSINLLYDQGAKKLIIDNKLSTAISNLTAAVNGLNSVIASCQNVTDASQLP